MALAMALAEVPLENYVESEPAKSEAATTSNLRGFPKRGHIQTFNKSGTGVSIFFPIPFLLISGIIKPYKMAFFKRVFLGLNSTPISGMILWANTYDWFLG